MSWANPGMLVRCVDARPRKVVVGAAISDFERGQAGIIDVMEILTVREVVQFKPYGGAWAVRYVEIERRFERVRRYRAKTVYEVDRPFLLDRFVEVRPFDDDEDEPRPALPREGALA